MQILARIKSESVVHVNMRKCANFGVRFWIRPVLCIYIYIYINGFLSPAAVHGIDLVHMTSIRSIWRTTSKLRHSTELIMNEKSIAVYKLFPSTKGIYIYRERERERGRIFICMKIRLTPCKQQNRLFKGGFPLGDYSRAKRFFSFVFCMNSRLELIKNLFNFHNGMVSLRANKIA